MNMRSMLGRARGLGSAKEGVGHWWVQRLTAIALVPLALWFVFAVLRLKGADHQAMTAWLGKPGNATLMILLVLTAFHHAQLGVQVVIEDYVHDEAKKFAAVIVMKLLALTLAVFAVVSVAKIAFGG